ncbi:MAG: thioredoxin family protein [Phycisphaerales bacterium]|jgi:thiol-disulfide isomerase/thioredoxin|nr:thioredoxin family protein [Phycisphaerales bacterium]
MSSGLTKEYLQHWFELGTTYETYLERAGDRATPWHDVGNKVKLSNSQRDLLSNFVRKMNVIVISGVWCGDCSAQGPILSAIESESPEISIRWLDRDEAIELSDKVKINAGNRVPTVIFMAEDFESVTVFGDKTLSRYRSIASRQLGSACDLPGIDIPTNELNETIQDWMNEFERIQLLLRLSGRLRNKHGD